MLKVFGASKKVKVLVPVIFYSNVVLIELHKTYINIYVGLFKHMATLIKTNFVQFYIYSP